MTMETSIGFADRAFGIALVLANVASLLGLIFLVWFRVTAPQAMTSFARKVWWTLVGLGAAAVPYALRMYQLFAGADGYAKALPLVLLWFAVLPLVGALVAFFIRPAGTR